MCHVIHQYEKSTTSTWNYDLIKESSYLMYWDEKNVYRWVMSLGLNEEKTSLYLMKNSYRTMIKTATKDTSLKLMLTLKRLGGQIDLPCGFSKNVFSKGRVTLWFFVTFNIIISHIFPENFIEIPQVVQKIWKISLSILAIFIEFHQFFGLFDISLLQRN